MCIRDRLEGIEVMNPVTHKPLPMFVSDYVLMLSLIHI